MKTKSVVVQVNDVLRAAGRKERLVRGRGYFMLYGGRSTELNEAGFPGWGLHPDFEALGFESIMSEVRGKFTELGVALTKRNVRCPDSGQIADDRVYGYIKDRPGHIKCHCGKIVKLRAFHLQRESSWDQIPSHNVPVAS